MPDVPAIPAHYRLQADGGLRTRSGGRILIGGAPLSILRLSPAGAKAVQGWFRGDPIGPSPTHQQLARRLHSNGMALLTPAEPPGDGADGLTDGTEFTVIVPVKDDPDGLIETLAAILEPGPGDRASAGPARVLVVDDGSTPPVTFDHPKVEVIRRPTAAGPGQARQQAVPSVATPLTVFVDAGVTINAAGLQQLTQRFDDPMVVAAAPRVRSRAESHPVARYDLHRSPLDLGPGPSLVGPGRMVPYVPTATLMVRTSALEESGGFDPNLRYGEDVDLVWRLGTAGEVLYVPQVEAEHRPRSSPLTMVTQRMSYGSAAAPLARRHGDAVSPARLSGWSVAVAALLAAGRPFTAAAVASGTALALRPKIEPLPDVTVEAFLLTGRGHWYGSLSLLTALIRTWTPLAILGMLLLPSQRKRLVGLLAAAAGRRLLDGPRTPAAAALDLGLGTVDDLSYCAGVWKGALKARSARALAPALVSWPKRQAKRSS